MGKRNIYDTALYLRLSKDDGDIDGSKKTESDSIGSQRNLLQDYVRHHEDLRLIDTYIDDGYSGVSFRRPEFQRMMEDIRAGRINCVLVKDLSRFGRDYIEAGRLIQKTFPAFSVRFIAVADGFDSLYADRTERNLILPVKNFINDAYCRDISMKVRAQQRAKRMEGKCVSAFAVYGYLKNPEDKNALVIDGYASDVVRKIFAWKMAGMSLAAIAEKLNQSGILSPLEYKKSLGMKYHTGFGGEGPAKWAATSVKRVLENQVYTGTMVQGKEEKANYKLKKRISKPREEWVCVKDTHEAIISEAEFRTVQELLKYDGRRSEDSPYANLFHSVLVCADCGAPMIRRVNRYKGREKVFYICRTKNKSLGCSRHGIREEQLKRIVFREIRTWLELAASYTDIREYLEQLEINFSQAAEYGSRIGILGMQYQKYRDLKDGLHTDMEEGLIDKEEFEELYYLYERKCQGLETSIASQKKIMEDMFLDGAAAKRRLDRMKETLEIQELTRELLVAVVRKILIHEDKGMEIVFRFGGEMEHLPHMRRFHKETLEQGGGMDGEDGQKI